MLKEWSVSYPDQWRQKDGVNCGVFILTVSIVLLSEFWLFLFQINDFRNSNIIFVPFKIVGGCTHMYKRRIGWNVRPATAGCTRTVPIISLRETFSLADVTCLTHTPSAGLTNWVTTLPYFGMLKLRELDNAYINVFFVFFPQRWDVVLYIVFFHLLAVLWHTSRAKELKALFQKTE